MNNLPSIYAASVVCGTNRKKDEEALTLNRIFCPNSWGLPVGSHFIDTSTGAVTEDDESFNALRKEIRF